MNALFLKDKICASDANTFFGKFGWFFAFFGDGTDCRCCLGIRIVLAFSLGLGMGALFMYSIIAGIAVLITFVLSCLLFFFVWLMIQAQAQRQEQEEKVDRIREHVVSKIIERVEDGTDGLGLYVDTINNIQDDFNRRYAMEDEGRWINDFIDAQASLIIDDYKQVEAEEYEREEERVRIIDSIIDGVKEVTGIEQLAQSYINMINQQYDEQKVGDMTEEDADKFINYYIDTAKKGGRQWL